MSFMTAMEIAASGLSAARQRMNLTASNLANANTTRAADGGPYQRKDLVVSTAEVVSPFKDVLRNEIEQQARGVAVTGIATDTRAPRTVYDPSHPDADAEGIVRLPNINMVEEMVDMITASRLYEAGITSIKSVKAMADKALSIGK